MMLRRILHPRRSHRVPTIESEVPDDLHESIELATAARKSAEIYISWLERALSPPGRFKRVDQKPPYEHSPEPKT